MGRSGKRYGRQIWRRDRARSRAVRGAPKARDASLGAHGHDGHADVVFRAMTHLARRCDAGSDVGRTLDGSKKASALGLKMGLVTASCTHESVGASSEAGVINVCRSPPAGADHGGARATPGDS